MDSKNVQKFIAKCSSSTAYSGSKNNEKYILIKRNRGELLKKNAGEDLLISCTKKEYNFYVTTMGRQHKHMYFDHMRNMDGKDLETVHLKEIIRDHPLAEDEW